MDGGPTAFLSNLLQACTTLLLKKRWFDMGREGQESQPEPLKWHFMVNDPFCIIWHYQEEFGFFILLISPQVAVGCY